MGVSVSEAHSRKNTRMGVARALRSTLEMARIAQQDGRQVQASVQSAFGCGFEGPIPEERVLGMVGAYLEAGLYNISLADTAGHAHPTQVECLFGAVLALDPKIEATCHFHNTYGLGMANIMAGMRAGVTSFETSFAGLGGCPFTKSAAGNVATEDFVNALQLQGLRGDVDLDTLIGVAGDVAEHFKRDMPGCVYKTGTIQKKAAA